MTKKRLPPDSRTFLETVWSITEANPFTDARNRLEAQLLNQPPDVEPLNSDNWRERQAVTTDVLRSLQSVLNELRPFVKKNEDQIDDRDLELFRTGVWFFRYHQLIDGLDHHREACEREPGRTPKVSENLYNQFISDLKHDLRIIHRVEPHDSYLAMNEGEVADLFAFCFQLRRGVNGIMQQIAGRSPAVARLRGHVWEAIFTSRLLWSYKYLKDRMANFSTLILGESGTGKDLVAEAIGTSQFIPYLPDEDRFAVNFTSAYHVVNLSALTPTLIESELFGHTRGSFTGASSDRQGILERCSPYGALFLDEIGELSEEIQVKLLRVLQSREFAPLGGGKTARFHGRILSATNRNITTLVENGELREDFLYRLGSVVIRAPSLHQRLTEYPGEMEVLLQTILERVLGGIDRTVFDELRERIAPLVESGYRWPGNVREFEQCVRSMLVASHYHPLVSTQHPTDALHDLFTKMKNAEAGLDEVTSIYCRHAIEKHGNYQTTAQMLGVDWRTVKKHAG